MSPLVQTRSLTNSALQGFSKHEGCTNFTFDWWRKTSVLCLPLTSGQVSSDNQTRRWFEQSMGLSHTINQKLVLRLLLVSDITE